MTITSTEIETVVDDLTAHEFELGCDVTWMIEGDCPHPARWAAIKGCCGGVTLLCTPCKDQALSTEGCSQCKQCDVVSLWREKYVYIEPLKKS